MSTSRNNKYNLPVVCYAGVFCGLIANATTNQSRGRDEQVKKKKYTIQ